MITRFRDEFFFLSNFYPCKITYEGITYPSTEAAFQAAKTFDVVERKLFTNVSPDEAKHLGRKVTLRKDWENVKVDIMKTILTIKFSDKSLMAKLLATNDELLVEGNSWHDNFWGHCECNKCSARVHGNMLGQLLMEIRG